MRRWLPAARSPMLARVAALVALFYAAIAIGFGLNVMRAPVGLLLAPLFALLAWGIWTLSRFARWVTLFWLWVLVLLLPLGVFTAAATASPYWGALLAGVTPLVVLFL